MPTARVQPDWNFKCNVNIMEDLKQSQENTENQITAEAPGVKNAAPDVQHVSEDKTEKIVAAEVKSGFDRKKNFKSRKLSPRKGERAAEEFEQKMIDIARVTRVMAGGKRMRFRACVAIGNKKGKVAIGLAKGADVTTAAAKAVNEAKKNLIDVPIVNETIPHEIRQKSGAAKILLKPAKRGRGIIAGGAVRVLLELSGIKNVTSKILGTGNKVNNVKCTIEALKNLKKPERKDAENKKRLQ